MSTAEPTNEHCRGPACGDADGRNATDSPVCECDCAECAQGRRPPQDVLADAYDALREEHNDFGDEPELFRELTELLAALVREREGDEIEAYALKHGL